jgi:uncharacterized protein YjeT (DUF2065 family)
MYKLFKLNTIKTFARKIVGSIALTTGIIGIPISILYLLLINPVSLLSSIFPIVSSPFGLEFYITQVMVQNSLVIFASQSILATSISSVLLLMGMGLLAPELWKGLKAFGRCVKASPMAIVRSPINTYKKVAAWRNWILAKVNYLNEESAKWKMAFNVMKAPYSFLRMMGLSPQMAIGLLTATTVAGTGVAVNETVFAERSFARGDSGVYAASVIGADLPLDVPTEYVEGSNTLRIDLGSTPVREITIENVSVGTVFTGSALPSGEANVVQISGNTIGGGTNTRLEIGTLIFEKSRCKKLTLTDIQAHTLIVKGNASDGQSIAPSPGTSRMRAIGGGHHQAEAMVTSGGTYDRIWIQAPTSGVNGKVGTLTLSNLYTKGGECVLSKMNVGTIKIELNEIGMGNGFATKEFAIATTVTAANMTIEDNVEVTIAEPSTQ